MPSLPAWFIWSTYQIQPLSWLDASTCFFLSFSFLITLCLFSHHCFGTTLPASSAHLTASSFAHKPFYCTYTWCIPWPGLLLSDPASFSRLLVTHLELFPLVAVGWPRQESLPFSCGHTKPAFLADLNLSQKPLHQYSLQRWAKVKGDIVASQNSGKTWIISRFGNDYYFKNFYFIAFIYLCVHVYMHVCICVWDYSTACM